MSEGDLRERLAGLGRRLYERGLAVAFEGNLSARLGRRGARGFRWLLSPSRTCKGELRPRDFLRMDESGQTDGAGTPSSELDLHLGVYRHLPEACAVIHAHPPHATAFACTREGLAPLLQPELLLLLGGPVPLAPYAPPGGPELFESVRSLLGASPVILLANHGVLAVSRHSPEEAFHFLEQVEQVSRVTWLARQAGTVRPLPEDEIHRILRGR
jgi:L-fuculose-phosphate aldolase